jgi:hypothetical protein
MFIRVAKLAHLLFPNTETRYCSPALLGTGAPSSNVVIRFEHHDELTSITPWKQGNGRGPCQCPRGSPGQASGPRKKLREAVSRKDIGKEAVGSSGACGEADTTNARARAPETAQGSG